jgi:hypothetical protein
MLYPTVEQIVYWERKLADQDLRPVEDSHPRVSKTDRRRRYCFLPNDDLERLFDFCHQNPAGGGHRHRRGTPRDHDLKPEEEDNVEPVDNQIDWVTLGSTFVDVSASEASTAAISYPEALAFVASLISPQTLALMAYVQLQARCGHPVRHTAGRRRQILAKCKVAVWPTIGGHTIRPMTLLELSSSPAFFFRGVDRSKHDCYRCALKIAHPPELVTDKPRYWEGFTS